MNYVCAIAKNENLYINDWVNYHLNLGFDKICLYDNNDYDTPFVGDFIDQKDKVEIVDVRGKHESGFQNKCYNDFYSSHQFSWVAFIDIDEFIVLTNWKNINDFLSDSRFFNTNVIRLNWHIFDDNDLIDRDLSISVYKAFTRKISHGYTSHGKEIVKGNIPGLKIESSHWCTINGKLPKQIMPDGKETTGKVWGLRDCKEAWINHYMTKSLSEFVNQKLSRTDAQFVDRKLGMDYYWNINKKSQQKVEWLKNHLNI